MSKLTGSNAIEGRMPDAMTAKRNSARVGPEASDNGMERIEQKGAEFFRKGGGFIPSSVADSEDGDSSTSEANTMGAGSTGSWAMKLDQGSDSPYPETNTSLKIKNTRKNNDGFFPG